MQEYLTEYPWQSKEQIFNYLENQKQSKETALYFETLRSAAKIDYTESVKENPNQG